MRKFLTVFFLTLALIAKAQNDTTKYYTTADYGWKYNRALFRHALALPTDTTVNKVERSIAYVGGNIYVKRSGVWVAVGGSSLDTSSLSSRIDARVKYSDTASMLSPYLRSATAAATYQPIGNYLTGIDTTTISTRAYARKVGDSTFARVQSVGYLTSIDTTTISTRNYTVKLGDSTFSRVIAQNYVTTSGARSALSMTTTGTTGAATYNNSTGVINVPRYDQERRVIAVYSANNNFSTISANSSLFITINGVSSGNTTESQRQAVVTSAGKFRNLYIRTNTAQPGTGSFVFTVRKNGVNQSFTITVAAGAGAATFSNTTDTIDVVAGDLISINGTNNASTASAAITAVSFEITNN